VSWTYPKLSENRKKLEIHKVFGKVKSHITSKAHTRPL
jgi:hypothetical protein